MSVSCEYSILSFTVSLSVLIGCNGLNLHQINSMMLSLKAFFFVTNSK